MSGDQSILGFDPPAATPWRFIRRLVRTAPADPFADPDWLVGQDAPRNAVIKIPKGPEANEGSSELGIHFQVIPYTAAGLLVNLRTIVMELEFEILIRMPQLNPVQGGAPNPIITNGNGTLAIVPGTQQLLRVNANTIAPSGLEIIPRVTGEVVADLAVATCDLYVAVG